MFFFFFNFSSSKFQEADDYRLQLQRLTIAFNEAFFDSSKGVYASLSGQTGMLLVCERSCAW